MENPNTSEGVEHLPLIACQPLEDKIPREPVPKVPLPIKMLLGEAPYASEAAMSCLLL